MKESDALKLSCPYAAGSPAGLCIGSGCMAWRWLLKPGLEEAYLPPDDSFNKGSGWRKTETTDAEGRVRWVRGDADGDGYCGRVGPPA